MWFPSLGLPVSLLGLAAQVPLQPPVSSPNSVMSLPQLDFQWKEGSSVFTPKDLLELARPGEGIANPTGDLIIISSSTYSLKDKK